MRRIKIVVNGMHCASCEMLLKDSLEDAGAKVLEISHKKGLVTVEYDEKNLNEAAIKTIIRKEKYSVV